MNDTAIKNYATWARRELIAAVAKRCSLCGIAEGADADLDAVDGRVLTSVERRQRRDLVEAVRRDGYEALVERAAYTWFNRLLAIRFMEVNDRLPSHVRVLSAPDGSFRPQALAEAMDLPLEALDAARAAELVQSGDDEALFRLVFLAQCDELSACMPAVFDKVGSAMELLLPDGLLRQGGVVEQLVAAIPEADWREGVEIVGWMYQYYVSERKDEVFASFKKGRKAERDAIAPATQLFTPGWIVRYLTENSLGRLWVLNNPESPLPEQMPYFIRPDEDAEAGLKRVSSPEEITVVDPACGSGHILVYAFDLLAAMYAEAGYSDRDAARLIVERNLSGLEIDPRAAAMASFCVTMKACELDSRFLRRGVSPRVTVLSRVELEAEELALCPNLRANRGLLDAAAHLDECGSLLQVGEGDLAAIAGDLASLATDGSIFAATAAEKLTRLRAELEPLAARYDVVVANPPYMGGSNMNKWLSGWVKDAYPDTKRDLCTCFIERGFSLAKQYGYEALITSDTCMYISSFEQMRKNILDRATILGFIDTRGTNAHPDVFDANAGWVLLNGKNAGYHGSYFKLNHPIVEKEARLLEALANPNCGWFYRRSADAFAAIPGSPIAYWASEAMLKAFQLPIHFGDNCELKNGMSTGENAAVVRQWFEVSFKKIGWASSHEDFNRLGYKYAPFNKGGEYRRWYGNQEWVLAYDKEANDLMDTFIGHRHNSPHLYFRECVSWSKISSGRLAMRFFPNGFVFDVSGCSLFTDSYDYRQVLGFFNSNVCMAMLEMISPTLNFEAGQLSTLPVQEPGKTGGDVSRVSQENICISKQDWDAFETSWDFERHPLI